MSRWSGLARGRAWGLMALLLTVSSMTGPAPGQEQPAVAPNAPAAQEQWPRQFVAPEGRVAIYRPQLESINEDVTSARAAVSVTRPQDQHPQFGAVWLEARWVEQPASGVVELSNVRITRARFHSTNDAERQALENIAAQINPTLSWTVSSEQWKQMVAQSERERAAAADIRSTPPKIVFSNEPAVLVVYDGPPQLSPIEYVPLMRVVNTPFFVVLDVTEQAYYFRGGGRWYRSLDPLGPWNAIEQAPHEVGKLLLAQSTVAGGGEAAAQAGGAVNLPGATSLPSVWDPATVGVAPKIITATEPTELIVIDGQPRFTPVRDTSLLYLTNSRTDVFLDVRSQRMFVLLSGRWFAAPSKEGPWTFVQANELPADFAKISPSADAGRVLAQVSGTAEAQEAIFDTAVPRVAAVKRETVPLDVVYDGDPQFAPIEGTNMMYAINTPYSIVLVDSTYYCCAQAVWYQSNTPFGPWVVCTSIPDEIHTIPPSCPIYAVRYVYVYDATDDWVYAGYTPGYLGSYDTGYTVVYGTGFWYRPWCGSWWWSWPCTFGWGACWSPWTSCWSFSFGFGSCFSWCGIGGWWGCGWPCSWSWCSWSCFDWTCSPTTVCAAPVSDGVVISGGVVAGGVAVGGTVVLDSQPAPGTPPSAGVTGMFGNAGARMAAVPSEDNSMAGGRDRGGNTGRSDLLASRAGRNGGDSSNAGSGTGSNAGGGRGSKLRVSVVNAQEGLSDTSRSNNPPRGGLVNGDSDWRGSREWSSVNDELAESSVGNDLGEDLFVDREGNVYQRPTGRRVGQPTNDPPASANGIRTSQRGNGSGARTAGNGTAAPQAAPQSPRGIRRSSRPVSPSDGAQNIVRTAPRNDGPGVGVGPEVGSGARPGAGPGVAAPAGPHPGPATGPGSSQRTAGSPAPPRRQAAPPRAGPSRIASPSGPSRSAPPSGARSAPPRSAPPAAAPRSAPPSRGGPVAGGAPRGGGPAIGSGARGGGGGGGPARGGAGGGAPARGGSGGNAGGKR